MTTRAELGGTVAAMRKLLKETPMPDKPESPTPRTDAAWQAIHAAGCLPGCDSYGHEEMCPFANGDRVMAEFARQLERELAMVSALYDKEVLAHGETETARVALENELAAANEASAKLASVNAELIVANARLIDRAESAAVWKRRYDYLRALPVSRFAALYTRSVVLNLRYDDIVDNEIAALSHPDTKEDERNG